MKPRPYILILLTLIFSSGICLAENIDVGEIQEISPDKVFIQVHDKTYKVTTIYTLSEAGSPKQASDEVLVEGAMVEVMRGEKHDEYWLASSVTVLLGDLEQEKRREMELPDRDIGGNAEQPKKTTEPHSGGVKLEGEVYTN